MRIQEAPVERQEDINQRKKERTDNSNIDNIKFEKVSKILSEINDLEARLNQMQDEGTSDAESVK